MAEAALRQSYADQERARLQRVLDNARGEVAGEAEQGLGSGASTDNAPAPQPQPQPEGQPSGRAPGVLPSIGRGLAAIPARAAEGVREVRSAMDEGGAYGAPTLSAMGRAALAALNVVFPFSAFAKETGGDLGMYLTRASGALTDEALQARLAEIKNTPQAPIGEAAAEFSTLDRTATGGDAAVVESLLAVPYEQRLEGLREAAGTAAEVLTGFIPGYTAIAKGVSMLAKGGKGAKEAAAGAKALGAGEKQLALGPGEKQLALGPGEKQPLALPAGGEGVIVPPGHQPTALPPTPTVPGGQVIDPQVMTLAGLRERLGKPAHRLTTSEIVDTAAAAREAMSQPKPKTLADLGAAPPPAAPREFSHFSQGLIQDNGEARAALDQTRRNDAILVEAKARKGAAEIVASTEANGGASFSVSEGRMRVLPDEGGFFVGVAPDRTVSITGRALAEQDILDFAKKNADLLSDPKAHIGTEKVTDKAGNTTYNLDVSHRFEDKAEAMALAQANREKRIFDGSTFESLDVPFRLEHYSSKTDLQRVDPDAFGTGQTGREKARAGEPGFPNRSYYYAAGSKPEARFAGLSKYEAEVPTARLVDISSAEGRALAKEAGNDMTRFEALAKERGFAGYYDSTGHMPGAVAVFEPLDVRKAGAPAKAADVFDPKAWAAEHGAVYQGTGGGIVNGQDLRFHEFREDALTGGGNFTVPGADLTRAGAEAALAAHYKTWGVSPNGKVGDKAIGDVAKARERLQQTWEQLRFDLGNESGTIRGEITPKLGVQTLNDLVTVGTEMMWTGARSFATWSARMVEELGDVVRPHLKDLYARTQAKLADVVKKSPDLASLKSVLALYHDGKRGLTWYDGAYDDIKAMYGRHADLFIDILAATSPHNSVKGNITMANDAMAQILSGERSAANPFRKGEYMDAHLQNLNRILVGQPVSGPKVGPFAQAIKGDVNAVVVDTWMLKAFGFPVGKGGRIDPSEARILFIETAVKQIAAKTGRTPRQVQAAIWTGKKMMDEGKGIFVEDLARTVRAKLGDNPDLAKLLDEAPDVVRAMPEATDGFEAFSRAVDELGEEGKVDLGVMLAVTRATLGAATGAALGENPEDRAYLALVGAGLGSIASAKTARKVADFFARPEFKNLFNEVGAMTPGQEIRAARRAQRAAREAMPNTQRMGTGPGATEAVRDVSERLSKLGYLTRDREMRHAETIAEAAKSRFHGNVEEILKLDEHEVLNAADGLAVRDTRDRMIEDWLQRAAQADESDPAAAQRVFDEYLLASKVVGTSINEGTAAGRTLEARSIVTNPARASELDYTKLSQDMDELRRGLDGVQVTPENVLQVARDLKDRSRVSKLMADAAKAPSAWWKIYYGLNLLSTPLFHLKNTIGNSTALTASMAGRLVGEITSAPFVAFGKRSLFGQPLVAPGETMDLVIGSLESVRDAFRAGRRTFDTGESMFRSTGKFAERADLLAQHRKSGFLSGLVDTAARLAEKNLRFAGGTDEFYKVLAFTGEQRALARRQAWASGAKWGEETLAEQARLINEPTRDIIDGAAAFADDATFTRAWDADTWSGRLMAKAESFAGEGLMRVTVTPFFHTPMRITEFATEHTPGLNLLMSGWWGDMKAGGANAQLAMAKVAVGGSMMYALSSYAAAGYITGDYSKDPALRARQIESGFKPFAFYVPQADKYISYAGLGPMVAPLAAVAQYAQMAPNVKDDGLITLFSAMTIAAAKTTLAQPYFDAASDVLDIFESLDNYESGQKAVKYVADRIQSFVPGASALRYVAAATEGERKDMKEFGATFDPEWRDVMNLFAQTAASIPGMASYVPAKRNIITGEAIPNEGGKWAGMVETPTNDPVLREILELGGASLPREFPRHVGGDKAPEDTFRLEPPKPGTVQPLTHEQRTKLAHLTTKVVKQRGKTLHEALADMIESDKYKAQSDGKYGGKALMIHQMWHAFADGAEERLIKEDLGLQEMIRRAQQDKLIQLAPTELQDELKERYAR